MEKSNRYLLFLSMITISLQFVIGNAAFKTTTNITAIYAFGDSVFDSGNNNKLVTVCRADHYPYGIDFEGRRPTGRFSNGKLPGDFLVSDLGIKSLLPAYAEMTESDASALMTGASFASSCSGLDDMTSTTAGVLTLNAQFKSFQDAFRTMHSQLGIHKAVGAVENGLFMIASATSDFMDNYYAFPLRRAQYSVPQYQDLLISNLETFVKQLNNIGAKRLGVIGLPPLGCLPVDVATNFTLIDPPECVSQHNSDARDYNAKLEAALKRMNVFMPNIKIAYMDIYNPIMDMVNNPNDFGIKNPLQGCCGAVELGPFCSLVSPPCKQRSEFVFFDAAHPTEATYRDLTNLFEKNVLPTLLN